MLQEQELIGMDNPQQPNLISRMRSMGGRALQGLSNYASSPMFVNNLARAGSKNYAEMNAMIEPYNQGVRNKINMDRAMSLSEAFGDPDPESRMRKMMLASLDEDNSNISDVVKMSTGYEDAIQDRALRRMKMFQDQAQHDEDLEEAKRGRMLQTILGIYKLYNPKSGALSYKEGDPNSMSTWSNLVKSTGLNPRQVRPPNIGN